MRVVRSNAKKWNIDPNKIGMLGFSAGGEVVSMVTYNKGAASVKENDSIDRMNEKPNFQILVYPGPLGIPDQFPEKLPPAFLVVANDDLCCSEPVMKVLKGYRKMSQSIEAHIYAKGGHAFNMGYRTKLKSLSSWPQRMTDWLIDNDYIGEMKDCIQLN